MEPQPHIVDALGKMLDAYTKSWWTMTQLLGAPPRPSDGLPRVTEDWFTIARAMKDGYVTVVNASFDLWEDQWRRAMQPWQPPPGRRP